MSKGGDSKERENNVDLQQLKNELAFFVNDVLGQKYIMKKHIKVGIIPDDMVKDIKEKGIDILSNDIELFDETIFKYKNHEKIKKGAVLPYNEYDKIVNTIKYPKKIYRDIGNNKDNEKKVLTYALVSDYLENKVLKIIIKPNDPKKKANIVLSIGIVNKDSLNENQYKEIKKRE